MAVCVSMGTNQGLPTRQCASTWALGWLCRGCAGRMAGQKHPPSMRPAHHDQDNQDLMRIGRTPTQHSRAKLLCCSQIHHTPLPCSSLRTTPNGSVE